MKFVNPLDVVAYYLHRGFTVQYMDTDFYRLEEAKKIKTNDPWAFMITDTSRFHLGGAQSHPDICIAVNTDEFDDVYKEEWLAYGHQSIEFFI